MVIKSIYVDMHEGTKDYVTGYIYINGELVEVLPDIAKPNNVADYTNVWKNGLWNEYHRIAIEKQLLLPTDIIVNI